jgi:catechol 2,3-dioxygenase-like lactoylglutathione lyase family enzyme
MKPRLKVITLGIDDLEASLAFYRDGLGLPTNGIIGTEFEDGAVVFIEINGGLILALYPRESLAKDAGLPVSPPSATDLSLGHCVGSRDEVDAVMAQATAAGARIVDPAKDRFWGGYSGYFQDPDGHLWEIAWNPAWPVDDDAP